MKKFPITRAFVKVIEDTSAQNGARQISRIWLKTGNGVCFKGNTLVYLKDILKGTVARNAEIHIRHGNTAGRCCSCGLVFDNEKSTNCPECGCAGESISLEKEFIIDRIELEA